MPRIKINDLPKDLMIRRDEMKRVVGGQTYYLAQSPLSIFTPIVNPGPFRPFFTVPSGGEEAKKCVCLAMPQDPAECMWMPE